MFSRRIGRASEVPALKPRERSVRPELLLVSLGQGSHAFEAEIILRRIGRLRGRAPALFGVAPVDPNGSQAVLVRRRVVVEQALRGVNDVLAIEAEVLPQTSEHVVEIPLAGLVRLDVLRGINRVE